MSIIRIPDSMVMVNDEMDSSFARIDKDLYELLSYNDVDHIWRVNTNLNTRVVKRTKISISPKIANSLHSRIFYVWGNNNIIDKFYVVDKPEIVVFIKMAI